MPVPDAVLLPLAVDAACLVADVGALPEESWVPHFNTGYYTGDWSGVPLHIVGGRAEWLFPDPDAPPGTPPSDTVHMARCRAVQALVSQVPSPVRSVRLLRLGPGAAVREHEDPGLGHAYGEARLHVPVHTDAGAEFVLNGRRLEMAPGECWYVDVSQPHAVANHGTRPRVHLVLDCLVDDWLDRVLWGAVSQE